MCMVAYLSVYKANTRVETRQKDWCAIVILYEGQKLWD